MIQAPRIILDPSNPVNNVAETGIQDWSGFKEEVVTLADLLGI